MKCRARVLGAALLLLAACGPRLPAAYVSSAEAARAAYEHGQYALAAEHWAIAERAAPNRREQDECRYRRAVSLQRAGQTDAARALLRGLADQAQGDRRERARFDHASSLIDEGQTEQGYHQLQQAVIEFPNFGLAPKATRQLLSRAEEQHGVRGALTLATQLQQHVQGSELVEVLLYERAKLVERDQGAAHALPVYRALVVAYPYPRGLYWDEAILRCAQLERQLAHPQRAIEWLHFMLGHREQSNFMGSYERHYAQAQLLLAQIVRDDLRDWERARTAFRKVFEAYPTSLLGDDALFAAAQLSHEHGDAAATCSDVTRLRTAFPESRYRERSDSLCPPGH